MVMIHRWRGRNPAVWLLSITSLLPASLQAGDRTISPAFFVLSAARESVLRASSPGLSGPTPSRPGRSGLWLHRTDMLVRLRALRGQFFHLRCAFFYFWSRARPETTVLLSGLFRALGYARMALASS